MFHSIIFKYFDNQFSYYMNEVLSKTSKSNLSLKNIYHKTSWNCFISCWSSLWNKIPEEIKRIASTHSNITLKNTIWRKLERQVLKNDFIIIIISIINIIGQLLLLITFIIIAIKYYQHHYHYNQWCYCFFEYSSVFHLMIFFSLLTIQAFLREQNDLANININLFKCIINVIFVIVNV